MPLREIQPLDEKDWEILVNDLEKGQTKEQTKFLQKAIKHAHDIPTVTY